MATRTIILAGTAANPYVILHRKDGSDDVWDVANTTTANYVTANRGDYDTALTQAASGSNKWYYTIPATLPVGEWDEEICERAGATPAEGDTVYSSDRSFYWSGAGVAMPVLTPGTAYMTIGEATALLQDTARAAGGLSDDNTGKYSLSAFHYALQLLLADFVLNTHATRLKSTVVTVADDATVDFSGITGFQPERTLRLWIDGEGPLEVNDIIEVVELHRDQETSDAPTMLAFTDFSTAESYPTPDAIYTINVIWWPDPTTWTIGSSASDGEYINIPALLLKPAIASGGVWFLQHSQLPEGPITDRRLQEYIAHRTRCAGKGGLGARSIRRTMLTY